MVVPAVACCWGVWIIRRLLGSAVEVVPSVVHKMSRVVGNGPAVARKTTPVLPESA